MEFSNWITKKYIEWRGERIGNQGSVTEFAKLFGASQQVMSLWMKPVSKGGKAPRSRKYINALVAMYGQEAYDVLGYEVSENPTPPERMPSALRTRLESAMREIANALEKQNLDPESEAAQQVAIDVMERHGFKYTPTE